MGEEQLIKTYLDAVHELALLPHGIGWTPEIGKRREELEQQVKEIRPQIDGLHRKYESKKIMKNNQKKIEGITIEIPENER